MTRTISAIAAAGVLGCLALGADLQEAAAPASDPAGAESAGQALATVPGGTQVPLVLINSVSSKHSQPGDPIYLESVYPVVIDGRILIPAGTHVSGSVAQVRRPGRVKGRGYLYIQFDQLILPNGVIRDLRGRPGSLDGRSPESFDRESGKVTSPGNKGEDAEAIARDASVGASIGTIAGAVGGRSARGLGLGAAVGAGAGLARVLLTRGPDAVLEPGTHIQMILEGNLNFSPEELDFQTPIARPRGSRGPGPDPQRGRRTQRAPSRFPL